MSLVPSLLQAIVKVDGEAMVMHAGDKPYVVSPTGQVELASRGLTLDAVNGIVGQLLPIEIQHALDEFGAIQYELPSPSEFPGEHFTVVAARGGDDVWVEIRRRRVVDDDQVPEEFFAPRAAAVVEPSPRASAAVPPSPKPTVAPPPMHAAASALSSAPVPPAPVVAPPSAVMSLHAAAPMDEDEDLSAAIDALDEPESIRASSDEAAEVELEAIDIGDDLSLPDVAQLWPPRKSKSDSDATIVRARAQADTTGDTDAITIDEPRIVSRPVPEPPIAAAEVRRPAINTKTPSTPESIDFEPADSKLDSKFEPVMVSPPSAAPPPWKKPVDIAGPPPKTPVETSAPPPSAQKPPVAMAPPPPKPIDIAPPTKAPVRSVPPTMSKPPAPVAPPPAPPAPPEVSAVPPGIPAAPPPPSAPRAPQPVAKAASPQPVIAATPPRPSAPPPPPTAAAATDPPPPTPLRPAIAERPETAQPAVVLPIARSPIRPDAPTPLVSDPTLAGLERLLRLSSARGASTLYLSSESRPSVRVDGELQILDGEPIHTSRDVESLLLTLMPERSHEALRTGALTEWICDIDGVGRVRCMSFRDHRGPGGVFRLMPTRSISVEQLGLPKHVQALAIEPEGLVLIAGPRSSGKRTLMAAFVDLMNRTRRDHIITIEREINIVHERGSSFISQREVRGNDEEMLAAARGALREDPDVLVIEDLRTGPLMNVALEAAASGHLVIGGFAAHTAAGAIDRIIDLYAPEYRRQVQFALADTLRGVVVQVLLRKIGGGRLPAREVLLNTAAVSSVIAEGKTSQLPMAIEGGRRYGMMPMNDALVALVQTGAVEARDAYRQSTDRQGFLAALNRQGIDTSFVERLA